MPRGSQPGERRGGRQKNTPNKRTQIMREAALRAGVAVPPGQPTEVIRAVKKSRQVLETFRDTLAGMAAFYQPSPPTAQTQNKNANLGNFLDCASLSIRCAEILQQYEEPKLKAILVAGDTGLAPREHEGAGNVLQMPTDPNKASRVYRSLILGGPPAKRSA